MLLSGFKFPFEGMLS